MMDWNKLPFLTQQEASMQAELGARLVRRLVSIHGQSYCFRLQPHETPSVLYFTVRKQGIEWVVGVSESLANHLLSPWQLDVAQMEDSELNLLAHSVFPQYFPDAWQLVKVSTEVPTTLERLWQAQAFDVNNDEAQGMSIEFYSDAHIPWKSLFQDLDEFYEPELREPAFAKTLITLPLVACTKTLSSQILDDLQVGDVLLMEGA